MLRAIPLLLILLACGIPSGSIAQVRDLMERHEVLQLHGEREGFRTPTECLIFTPQDDLLPETKEPRTSAPFSTVSYAFTLENGKFHKRFSVYVPDRLFLPFAKRAARFLAIVWTLADKRFDILCPRLREVPVDVWMTRSGEAGGEQERTNIYVYNLLTERPGIEWARELAHEYGHYILPAPSGYTNPESWGNGVLGERLFLNWLCLEVSSGKIDESDLPYVKEADLKDYRSKQINPLLDRMMTAGPDIGLLARVDRPALDAFTGLMLYIDSVYGSRTILRMLEALPLTNKTGMRGPDFLSAFTAWIGGEPTLHTGIPPRPATLIYLPKGNYKVHVAPKPPPTLELTGGTEVSRAGDTWTVRIHSGGWHKLRLGDPNVACTLRWDRTN